GYTGQISLAQGAFYGIGAYVVALLTTRAGLDFWIALLAALLFSSLLGLLLGLVTLRISGHYLAMVTISFQVIVTLVLSNWVELTGGPDGVTGIMRPSFGPVNMMVDRNFLYLTLGFLAVVAVALWRLKRSHWGRAMQAVRENELAAEVIGVPTFRTKVLAFVISAALGGLGGALYAVGSMYISPDTFEFGQSVTFLTMVLLGGAQWVIGSLFGAMGLTLLPQVLRSIPGSVYLAIYGVVVILVMVFLPEGIWGLLARLARRAQAIGDRRQATDRAALLPPVAYRLSPETGETSGPLLRTEAVAKRFGGVRAVDGVDLQVQPGDIHALIGPNGSGKSTLLNLLNAIYTPSSGRIWFRGLQIQNLPPHRIAALGMARTFQNIRLFRGLSVLDNVMIGADTLRYRGTARSAAASPVQVPRTLDVRRQALAALHFVGLTERAGELARNLPYGHQRLVEIARALAGEPYLLLLDEPGAGMNPAEKGELVALIRRLHERGLTVLLVEHDMSMVTEVAQTMTVLNFGAKIAAGRPQDIMTNKDVIDAYLGAEASEAVAR
ncbi:MAG TPA: branched-chain amino acid ABC transporter ATP-binding protein/permease, partial [Chloroflexota bacterium]|nr:branched-chain amino acid ABC transporter ATP-binding protein/permease [Chloroflexota bacterium]